MRVEKGKSRSLLIPPALFHHKDMKLLFVRAEDDIFFRNGRGLSTILRKNVVI
jgi:hypothetical protein